MRLRRPYALSIGKPDTIASIRDRYRGQFDDDVTRARLRDDVTRLVERHLRSQGHDPREVPFEVLVYYEGKGRMEIAVDWIDPPGEDPLAKEFRLRAIEDTGTSFLKEERDG